MASNAGHAESSAPPLGNNIMRGHGGSSPNAITKWRSSVSTPEKDFLKTGPKSFGISGARVCWLIHFIVRKSCSIWLAVQLSAVINICNDVRSVKDSPPVLHIQNLDGEDIRGIPQLIFREEKRRRLFLLDAPPFHPHLRGVQLLDTHERRMQTTFRSSVLREKSPREPTQTK